MQANTQNHRIYKMSVASVYVHYVAKVEKRGRLRAEVNEAMRWMTGYTDQELTQILEAKTNFEAFFASAPKLNPARKLITGTICGVKLAEISDPLMLEIRYLDKLIDELAKGKAMSKILRQPTD